jgi:hypothetical protein
MSWTYGSYIPVEYKMRPNYKRPARFERERAKSGRRQREIHHSQSMHGRHICRSIHIRSTVYMHSCSWWWWLPRHPWIPPTSASCKSQDQEKLAGWSCGLAGQQNRLRVGSRTDPSHPCISFGAAPLLLLRIIQTY